MSFVRLHVSTLSENVCARLEMLCPHCSECHGAHGDVGGTAYADVADRGRRLLERLCKYRRVRIVAFAIQLRAIACCAPLRPRDLQLLAHSARAHYPCGIVLVHEGLRACFLFRATAPPQFVSFDCCLRLLRSGNAAGFLLLRGRIRWLSARRNT